jgi:archaeosine synthase beta-subunit
MCDLWKNTLDSAIPNGLIPRQIEWALSQLPPTSHIKLYNSGNFFDKNAIPVSDYSQIAQLIAPFESLTVECHPKFIREAVVDFKTSIHPELEVAIGLETVNPKVLPLLNKQMTLKDFSLKVQFLSKNDIKTRAFILLKPPFHTEHEGVIWAKKSIDFAFNCGVECCSIIPVRAGNGAMNRLQEQGFFSPPAIKSLTEVLEYGIKKMGGRVFADLWDLYYFSDCENCFEPRKNRLEEMNLSQKILPITNCSCCDKRL